MVCFRISVDITLQHTLTQEQIPRGFKPSFAAGPKLETCVTRLPETSRHLCNDSFSGWTRQDRGVPLEQGADSTTSHSCSFWGSLSLLSWEVAHSRNGQATSTSCLHELNVSWKPPTPVLTPVSPTLLPSDGLPALGGLAVGTNTTRKTVKMCAQTHGFFHVHQIITKNISTAVSFCCRGKQGKGSTWPKLLSQGYSPCCY